MTIVTNSIMLIIIIIIIILIITISIIIIILLVLLSLFLFLLTGVLYNCNLGPIYFNDISYAKSPFNTI